MQGNGSSMRSAKIQEHPHMSRWNATTEETAKTAAPKATKATAEKKVVAPKAKTTQKTVAVKRRATGK